MSFVIEVCCFACDIRNSCPPNKEKTHSPKVMQPLQEPLFRFAVATMVTS
jgi:hypothetical protein